MGDRLRSEEPREREVKGRRGGVPRRGRQGPSCTDRDLVCKEVAAWVPAWQPALPTCPQGVQGQLRELSLDPGLGRVCGVWPGSAGAS